MGVVVGGKNIDEAQIAWAVARLGTLLEHSDVLKVTEPRAAEMCGIYEELAALQSMAVDYLGKSGAERGFSSAIHQDKMALPSSPSEGDLEYINRLQGLRERATAAHAAREILAYHALFYMRCGQRMPDVLLEYAQDRLIKGGGSLKPRGQPPLHPSRDVNLFMTIEDIANHFDVSPTRNAEALHKTSAIDIVVAAMKRLKRQPDEYETIRAIWHREQAKANAELLRIAHSLQRKRKNRV